MISPISVPAETMLINITQKLDILLARNSKLNERVKIRRMVEENGISPIMFNQGVSAIISHMIMMDVAMKIGDDQN